MEASLALVSLISTACDTTSMERIVATMNFIFLRFSIFLDVRVSEFEFLCGVFVATFRMCVDRLCSEFARSVVCVCVCGVYILIDHF